MKLTFTEIIEAKFLVLAATLLLSGQADANVEPRLHSLTPTQIQRLSSGLFQPKSQDFFSQGQERIEREILLIERKQPASAKPLLKVNELPQIGKKRSSD